MRRNREPGTRKPLSWPESKQRMIVCWLTLQILAASPVVNTVFMVGYVPSSEPLALPPSDRRPLDAAGRPNVFPDSTLTRHQRQKSDLRPSRTALYHPASPF